MNFTRYLGVNFLFVFSFGMRKYLFFNELWLERWFRGFI